MRLPIITGKTYYSKLEPPVYSSDLKYVAFYLIGQICT